MREPGQIARGSIAVFPDRTVLRLCGLTFYWTVEQLAGFEATRRELRLNKRPPIRARDSGIGHPRFARDSVNDLICANRLRARGQPLETAPKRAIAHREVTHKRYAEGHRMRQVTRPWNRRLNPTSWVGNKSRLTMLICGQQIKVGVSEVPRFRESRIRKK